MATRRGSYGASGRAPGPAPATAVERYTIAELVGVRHRLPHTLAKKFRGARGQIAINLLSSLRVRPSAHQDDPHLVDRGLSARAEALRNGFPGPATRTGTRSLINTWHAGTPERRPVRQSAFRNIRARPGCAPLKRSTRRQKVLDNALGTTASAHSADHSRGRPDMVGKGDPGDQNDGVS